MEIKRICASIAAAALTGLCVFATEPVLPSYVALGDSIASGYGLYDVQTECYTNLIAAEIGVNAANYANYAVNGMTSGGLLNALDNISEGSEAHVRLKNASLITVSIGSNDLLSKLSGALRTLPNGTDPASLASLEATLTSEQKLAEFDAGVKSYETNLPLIYARLREFNKSTQIIMTEFYNPYQGMILGAFDFGALSDEYIARMNGILHDNREKTGYTIAAIYETVSASGMTNVNPENSNTDPHPNARGHLAIAQAVLSVTDFSGFDSQETAGDTESASAGESQQTEQTERNIHTEHKETSTASDDGAVKSHAGTIFLTVLAVSIFAVTGIIITKNNKRTG